MEHSDINIKPDEPDLPPVKFVLIITVLAFVFVFLVWIFGNSLLWKWASFEEAQVTNGMDNSTRLAYVAAENDKLNSYKKLDDDFYQIPIELAMQKVVARSLTPAAKNVEAEPVATSELEIAPPVTPGQPVSGK